ncbi:MAG: MBL fold metallo-hydrolase [Bacilli bacterium]|nr:MBL fold metallo-hydrolase [Bacilli bacterium]
MKVTILASGSKGNCTLIETDQNKILIYVGISYRLLNTRLKEVNVSLNDIDAIFITHEHTDHVQGLEKVLTHHNIYVALSHGTYEALVSDKKIGITYEHFNIIEPLEEVYLNDISILPIPLSHDANEPFGYVIKENNKKVVYLTDTGFVSQENEEYIKDADVYIFETNHNIEMLMMTKRPWSLIQRIIGDKGHLCNEDALNTLMRVVGKNTKVIYLAHISEEANNVDLLYLTVEEIFSKSEFYHSIKFIATHQYQITEPTII